jgi:putative membrane protein
MRKIVILITAILGTALIVQSCKKDKKSIYTMTNQAFVTQASSSNMFEIAAGQLAANKNSRINVKAYGSYMVTDHTLAAKQMADLAQKKGLVVPLNVAAREQNRYNTLAALSGADFDKEFASIMVTSHQETIELFKSASSTTGVPDADLRAFAAGKLPELMDHLTAAQNLQTQVNQ